jgi:hypothetical protein
LALKSAACGAVAAWLEPLAWNSFVRIEASRSARAPVLAYTASRPGDRLHFKMRLVEPMRRRRPLQPRPIAVDGVGDKNAGAHNAEECGNSFEHWCRSLTQRSDQTPCNPAQSKGFRATSEFEKLMMILSNTIAIAVP